MMADNTDNRDTHADERLAAARIKINKMTIEDWQAHSALLAERVKQLDTWTPQHDDWHSPAQWCAMLIERVADIAGADDWIGPLTLIAPEARARAQRAAIELGALAWALLAATYRGDLYESGERAIDPDNVPTLRLFLVRFWYVNADGATAKSDEYRIVTRTHAEANEYARTAILPTLDYAHAVENIECMGDGEIVYLSTAALYNA